MTWRRRTGVVTVGGARAGEITAFLDRRGVLAVVESRDAAYESIHITLAVDAGELVATIAEDGAIAPGPPLADLAQDLATTLQGDVAFGDEVFFEDGLEQDFSDPFEQSLGADIALFAERAAVFTRAPARGIVGIATQVDDVVHALPHLDGHTVLVTEGPLLATLDWDADTRPALILEAGGDSPSLTVIPDDEECEAYVYAWDATRSFTPTSGGDHRGRVAAAFVDATLSCGGLVRQLMKSLPAIEPGHVRRAIDQEMDDLPEALGLPAGVIEFLSGETSAADIPGVREVHPASFARSVRRVVTEAQTTMAERAESVRERAVAVRTRAETAFDAAEAFAEDVVLPVRQNWVSPALAVAETTLGVLALRRARRSTRFTAGALGTGGALLLADAVVNTVISLAPLLRRKN